MLDSSNNEICLTEILCGNQLCACRLMRYRCTKLREGQQQSSMHGYVCSSPLRCIEICSSLANISIRD